MSIGYDGLHHCYNACFGRKMFHAKNALQLLEDENYRCPTHEASDSRMGKEIHQYPKPARACFLIVSYITQNTQK